MARKTNVADLPKLLTPVASFSETSSMDILIIPISTNFNKHKKYKLKIVKNVENLRIFQNIFNMLYFSTFYKKHLKTSKKLLKTMLKTLFQQIQQPLQ